MKTCFSNRRPSQWFAQIAGIKKADLLGRLRLGKKLAKRIFFGTIK